MQKVHIYRTRGNRTTPVAHLEPIRYGQESRFESTFKAMLERGESPAFVQEMRDKETAAERCPDCACKKGEYHHPGCDWEECPHCHNQLLSCSGECG